MARTGNSFIPIGPTSKIAAATTAPTALTLAGDMGQGTMTQAQYRIMHSGNEAAFCAWGGNASAAASNVVIPTNATVGGNSYPVPGSSVQIITAPTGQYWTAITSTNNFAVYITPGRLV